MVGVWLLYTPDTDPDAMHQKYGGELARYVDDGDGGKIHYRDQGPRNAPTLLLIHGTNASLHTWEGIVPQLAKQYRVISYDQHAHGLTGPHPRDDYSPQARIKAAFQVLDAAGVEQAVLIGNSMGGWLTWRATLANPERVSAMVLLDASGPIIDVPRKLYLGARLANSSFGQWLMPYVTPRPLITASAQGNYADHSKITDALVTRYWELLRYPGNRRGLAMAARTDRQPDYWHRVGEIKQPTLLLWGAQDAVTPPAYGRAFDKALPNSQLILYDNAGHLPMEEIPEQVASDLLAWLATQSL
ncbi:MAG: alpha/beta hydrolase [Gammaproteobacteria bacterium]|nr:alpha/beta hydrolase [Gammaproteobacteria bacterium]